MITIPELRKCPAYREAEMTYPGHSSTKLQTTFSNVKFSLSYMNRNINILFIGLLLLLPALIFTSLSTEGASFMTSLLARVQLLRNHLQVPFSALRVFGANMSVSRVNRGSIFAWRHFLTVIIDRRQDYRLGYAW